MINFLLGMFLYVTLLIFRFMESQSENLKVTGPDAPLVAVAGEDLVLPCFIKPNTSAVDMTVEWFRPYVKDSLVHLYKDHEDRNENQAQAYRGRTSFFKEELQKGNISLRLSAVQVSDEGLFKCLVEDYSWYDDITLHIIVEARGSHPVITMESYDNTGGINLVCESRGWNPQPEVLWLDREGAPLPAEDTQIKRHIEGFTVKRRTTVYDYSDSNRFYCRLLQKHHLMEAEIIIDSKAFDTWKWAVGITVAGGFMAAGLIVAAVFCDDKEKKRQKIENELQQEKQNTEFIKKKKKFAVDVTLDPNTAHPIINLSNDGKQVTCKCQWKSLPDTPQRFSVYPFVLGKQSVSSGRFYYEVQVSGKTWWILGVAGESINRKEVITLSPQDGLWSVGLVNQYRAHADPHIPLTLRDKVEKVGVFLDYDVGLVSFYDVESITLIYSFTNQSFTEKLYPIFSPWYNIQGTNSAPMIITPVLKT
ncbi:butyrophilin subfamily 1 member A1-like isoform 2-T2 [Clarias gariepinus]|uniref:butyrophilin subfamily 1 member A1-like isoform X2 n=1 Tax=Clarias gariepinus TaxID=13013 RepID=UPI00234D81D7|nr:butyrophilin subfamily 1 member A1-like isoform X2 [Clarias gariepinus]